MPSKKLPKKTRGTDARQMISALRRAGVAREDIVLTSDGHLQVTCPGGLVTMPSDLSQSRAYANSRKELAAHGVHIPARGGGARRGPVREKQHQQHRRRGQVTRCSSGETYALVTTANGDGDTTWFISRQRLRPDVAAGLVFGRFVTFTGNPVPDLHQRYPHADNVRLDGPPPPEQVRVTCWLCQVLVPLRADGCLGEHGRHFGGEYEPCSQSGQKP